MRDGRTLNAELFGREQKNKKPRLSNTLKEGMGGASLAPRGAAPAPPQGAAPAPPLQEGMRDAFLAPQCAALVTLLQEGMGEASLAPQVTPPLAAVAAEDNPTKQPRWRQRQQTAANRINNQQMT